MMEDSALSRWIYLGVLTVFVGGAMKHLSGAPGDLVEPLWTSVLPVLSVLSVLPVLLLLLLLLLLLRLAASSLCSPGLLPAGGKAVLITGCDSGFGKATVQRLDSLGFQVFATVLDLNGDGARELRRSCSSLLTLLQVDITQPQEVQQALLDTQAKLGHRGLWGLVNNAGVCVNFGDVELSLMKNFRGCMEVNFFGTLNVTKSFLPLLRLTRGRIVTVSSPAGDQPFPCLSAYGASKAALNLLTDTLRHELEPWGVRVSTVLPSSYRTGRCSDREHWERQHKELLQGLAPALLEDYGEDYVTETKDLFHSYAARANTDLSPVVDAIVQALLAPRPRTHYYAGPGVGLMYFVHSYCPPRVSSHFLKKLFVRKTLKPRALRMVAGSDQDLGLDMSLHHHNNNNNNNNNDNEKLQ